jgi:hypothetical protein
MIAHFRRIRFFSIILLILLAFVYISCKNEDKCTPRGKWYFNKVLRDFSITNTLANGYIDFADEKVLKSNLFDESVSFPYKINDKEIVIETNEKMTLTIDKCSSDTMILVGKLGYFNMQFLMTKNPNEIINSAAEDSNLY